MLKEMDGLFKGGGLKTFFTYVMTLKNCRLLSYDTIEMHKLDIGGQRRVISGNVLSGNWLF